MNKDLSQKLFSNYKFLFQDPETGETAQLMRFGFECGDGWYNILDSLFSELSDNVLTLILEKEGLKREIEKTQSFIEKPRNETLSSDGKERLFDFDEAMERLTQTERERLKNLKKELENTDIEIELAKRNAPRVRQVKEKFGTLNVYGFFPENKQSAINLAERLSERTCEKCGSPGALEINNHYYQTLCPTHSKKDVKS